jgi:hypothetical protein
MSRIYEKGRLKHSYSQFRLEMFSKKFDLRPAKNNGCPTKKNECPAKKMGVQPRKRVVQSQKRCP